MILPSEYDLEEQLEIFQNKIKEKCKCQDIIT